MSGLVDRFIHRYGRLPTEFDPDYLEMLRMNKYRILAVPDVKPGKCANCGSTKNDGRKYVDIGLDIDWYGVVFLCGFCLRDVAVNVGLFKDYEDRLSTAKAELLKISNERQYGENLGSEFTRIFEEVKAYYDNLRATGNSGISSSNTGVGTDSSDSESGTDQTESGTSESDSSTGRKNVSGFTDLLNS